MCNNFNNKLNSGVFFFRATLISALESATLKAKDIGKK